VRVLLIEPELAIAERIGSHLEQSGFAVDAAATWQAALELAASGAHDLVLLDLSLPEGDGIVLCRNLRRASLAVPVLVISSDPRVERKVQALDAGADDYLVEPYELEELGARIRALLRRGPLLVPPTELVPSTEIGYGDLRLDLLRRAATCGDRTVSLSPKQFALLEFLMRNPDRVLTRTAIAERLWNGSGPRRSNVLDAHVAALRRKMPGAEPRIHTVVGSGYRFGAP
jgi:DNA-binding response OmpR family regulator